MCAVCRKNPCDSRCPNAEEPKSIYACEWCEEPIYEGAHLARQHNNANVLVMPGRFIDEAMADKIMTEFFTTDFEGGRHQARIDKIPVR